MNGSSTIVVSNTEPLCNCRECSKTTAELMLEVANGIIGITSRERNKIKAYKGTTSDDAFAMVAVAIRLRNSHKLLIFRAIAEDWNHARIIRELY